MILKEACTHRPLTTMHWSISWCSYCRHWLVHSSQSGRRSAEGAIVLIEVLQIGRIEQEGSGPDDLARMMQQWLLAASELEDDRRITDALM